MGKSYCIHDKAGFHDLFYAGAATCYSRKSSVSFHIPLPHTTSPVDILLDFTFVRAFFTLVLSQVFNCRNLVSSFVIAQ